MNGRPWLSLFVRLVVVLFVAIAATTTAPALADSVNVTTLGVRSLDGEDQLERRASSALRTSARTVESYRVSDRDVSLAQMGLAHGCEEVDEACLADIATTLSAERLLYGNMVRSGDKVRISLFNFNAQTGKIDATADRTLGGTQLTDPLFAEAVTALVQKLAGTRGRGFGSLRISGNRPGSVVSVDDKEVGVLDENGELLLPKISEGTHQVSVVTSDGRDRRDLSAEVRPDTTTSLKALLTRALPQVTDPSEDSTGPRVDSDSNSDPARGRKIRRILGWTSIGVAAGFAIATVATWVRISNISDNKHLNDYRFKWPKASEMGGTDDACREAKAGNLARKQPQFTELEKLARNLCNEADRLETLQYVFIGGTVLFGGTGTILLLTAREPKEKTFSVRPRVGTASLALEANFRF